MQNINYNYSGKLLLLILAVLFIFIFALNTGSESQINLFIFFNNQVLNTQESFILFQYRLPRIIVGFFVGMALSGAGVALQGLFRNPLVDPFVIGISGGGALGAGLAFVFGLQFIFFGMSPLPFFAFAGAIITMFLVYKLGTINGMVYIDRLLLAGIAISSLCSAILSLLIVIKGQGLEAIVYWILGSLNNKGWEHVLMILPFFIFGILIITRYLRDLYVFQTGEEIAMSLGIKTEKLKIFLIFASTLLAAASVSVSGIIGFVGLIIPHLSRLFINNSDVRYVFPVSLLMGGGLLVLADTMARTLLSPQQIPVGIFTAILGVPFFLSLLPKHK